MSFFRSARCRKPGRMIGYLTQAFAAPPLLHPLLPLRPTAPLRELLSVLDARSAAPMTAILGISAFYHDSAAALVVDGQIVAAAQEERFTPQEARPRLPEPRDRLLPGRSRPRPAAARLRRLLRQAAAEVRTAAGDLPGLRPARLPLVPAGDAALAASRSCTCPAR